MTMIKYIFPLFLLLSTYVAAEKRATEDWNRREAFINPESLDEKIINSWEGGRWQEKGIDGSFRFIVTQFKVGQEKLYVQWVTSAGEIAYSLSVKEINVVPEYDIDLPRCVDGDDCREIIVNAKHYYEGLLRKFTIKLDGLGQYAFHM